MTQSENSSQAPKRLLLINAQGSKQPSGTAGMNIGMGYVAAAFRRFGWEVSYIDQGLRKCEAEDLIREAAALGPMDVIGVHVFTIFVPYVMELVQALRRAFPNVRLIAGGPFPSATPELAMRKFPELDALIEGEAEGAFPEFDRFLRDECPAADVPGLWARGADGAAVRGAPRRYPDLSEYPMPAWDLMQPQRYFAIPGAQLTAQRAIATVFTRGCPFHCAYCSAHAVTGRQVRTRPMDVILDELKMLRDVYGAQEIIAMDDGLTINRKFLLEFCRAVVREGLNLSFSAPNGVRLDSMDREVLDAMSAAGFYSLAVGIEAGTQSRLDKMRKQLTIQTIRDKVQLVKETAGMTLIGHFILGYPHETVEEARNTIRLARELPLDRANFFSLMLLPGTEIYEEAVAEGLIQAGEFESRSAFVPGRTFAAYSETKLHLLMVEAYVGFYLTRGRFAKLLRRIRDPQQFGLFLRLVWRIVRG